jgi:ribosome-binding protein aMBF1 (putative translation factor)
MKTTKLRNLDQLTTEQRQALESVLNRPENTFATPPKNTGIAPEINLAEIKNTLENAVLTHNIGEALEQARKQRGLSGRAVAKKRDLHFTRVQQLEHATNLEIISVVRHAASLDYKVTLVLEPLEGGQRILATLGQQ